MTYAGLLANGQAGGSDGRNNNEEVVDDNNNNNNGGDGDNRYQANAIVGDVVEGGFAPPEDGQQELVSFSDSDGDDADGDDREAVLLVAGNSPRKHHQPSSLPPLLGSPTGTADTEEGSSLSLVVSTSPEKKMMNGAAQEDKKSDESERDNADEARPPPPPHQPKQQSFMDAARSEALRPFVIISTSYLLFTVTDGAIRMIVLLHAYNKNFSALEVAIMFTLYELAGVFTNLAAGFLGARWGIKYTLISGLCLQLVSYGLLFGWQDDWTKSQAIVYVTIAQMFAGIAKDLTKLGGKTVTKLVTPQEQETKLFKLVSLLTGWKNSLKGVGYFLGSALLQASYFAALGFMMALVLLAMPWAIFGLSRNLGTARKENATLRQVFTWENTNLTILSCARLFLFASRDFWFEVPLPFFLRSPLCDGLGTTTCTDDTASQVCTSAAICADNLCQNLNIGGGCGGLGLPRVVVGAFLGGYIILYGQVQSWTPQLVTGPLKQTPPNKLTEVFWGLINCIPTLVATCVVAFSPTFENGDQSGMTAWLVVIVVSFAVVFAINSSIHSYLVVKYASHEKVAVSVGLYYMSNAMGRLLGTIGSGLLYTYVGETINDYSGSDAVAGLAACFLAGTLCSLVAAAITIFINDNEVGLKCGSCWTIVPGTERGDDDDDDEDDGTGDKDLEQPMKDTDSDADRDRAGMSATPATTAGSSPASNAFHFGCDDTDDGESHTEAGEALVAARALENEKVRDAVENALRALSDAAAVTESIENDEVSEALHSAIVALEEAAAITRTRDEEEVTPNKRRVTLNLGDESLSNTLMNIKEDILNLSTASSAASSSAGGSEVGEGIAAVLALEDSTVNAAIDRALSALQSPMTEDDEDEDFIDSADDESVEYCVDVAGAEPQGGGDESDMESERISL